MTFSWGYFGHGHESGILLGPLDEDGNLDVVEYLASKIDFIHSLNMIKVSWLEIFTLFLVLIHGLN